MTSNRKRRLPLVCPGLPEPGFRSAAPADLGVRRRTLAQGLRQPRGAGPARAATLDELLARDFSDRSRRPYAHAWKTSPPGSRAGRRSKRRWTFSIAQWRAGRRRHHHLNASPLPDDGHAMLFEGAAIEAEAEHQRAIEALRHTSALVSLYDADGFRVFGNPASVAAYPGETVRFAEIFRRWRRPARYGVRPGPARRSRTAYRVITAEGERWHGLAARRTPDPVTRRAVRAGQRDRHLRGGRGPVRSGRGARTS
ncbi:hypothetical protein ACRAWD_14860 [Caulobacter segnis]